MISGEIGYFCLIILIVIKKSLGQNPTHQGCVSLKVKRVVHGMVLGMN